MARIPGLRRVLQWPSTRRTIARGVDDELDFHLTARTQALIDGGMTPAAAREAAEREFGDVRAARTELMALDAHNARRNRLRETLDAVAFDVRYAVRGLKSQPALTVGIVLTLALGIGANATMFGVVDRLLLRAPAHVRDPGHLARVYFTWSTARGGAHAISSESYPTFLTLRDSVPSFAGVAAISLPEDMTSGRGVDAIQVKARLVTPSFFSVLGVEPALGRFFAEDEARPPGGASVVVLSYGFWQRRFGGDPAILGRTIPLGRGSYTIVGVTPKGFTAADLSPVDVWLPVSAAGRESLIWHWATEPHQYWLQMVARLRPGEEARQAAAEASIVYEHLVDAMERAARHPPIQAMPVTGVMLEPVVGARNSDGTLTAEARMSRWLIGVSIIVLLIACANVVNLLLARATRRRREIAVRLALGIGRRRLVAQLVVEGVLLALIGGALGLAVAHWGGALMRTVLIPGVLWSGSPVNGRVLGVTAALTLATGVVIGLVPALQAGRTELTSALKSGVRDGVRRTRLRSGLIVMQAALSVVLLVGAGLFLRSLESVRSVDLGMKLGHVLVATVDLESAGYTDADQTAFFHSALERVRHLPGVTGAAVASAIPFGRGGPMSVIIRGRQDSIVGMRAGAPWFNAVTPGFFSALGMRIVRGREFTEADREGSQHVAIIDETMARTVWPGEDAIGQCMILGSDKECTTVIGVVNDARRWGIHDDPAMALYAPLDQGWDQPAALLVRTRGDPARLEGAVRHTLQTTAANLPYADVHPLQDLLNPQIRPWKLGATMFGVFALLALIVASVGLYSVLAYDVAQRIHEMGVRMALGARAPDVVRLILGEGVRMVLIGIVLGLAATLAAGRAIASLLFDTSPHDPLVLSIVCVTLLVVAVAASLLPAWRATRVDPNIALRAE